MGQVRVVDLARTAGADRTATAAAISAAAFPDGSDAAFVATGDSFADALAAGPAAASAGAPILLVRGGVLSSQTQAELQRLAPKRITIVGGPGAVSDEVAADLRGIAPVTRVAGADRFATAARLAELVPNAPIVYVATGAAFADALVGGAAAAKQHGALLLTDRDQLPAATADSLKRLRPARIIVLGGTGAISSSVEAALVDLHAGTVERIAGSDRYATAAAVTRDAFEPGVAATFVVTGQSFGDALAATPAAAAAGAPLLLTQPGTLPAVSRSELERLVPGRIVVVGGPAAVAAAVEDELATYL